MTQFTTIALQGLIFRLGRVVITANADRRINRQDVQSGLLRHLAGDWGDISTDDAAANAEALRDGDRLHSVYRSGDSEFWIITEADRSTTTVLLPDDY